MTKVDFAYLRERTRARDTGNWLNSTILFVAAYATASTLTYFLVRETISADTLFVTFIYLQILCFLAAVKLQEMVFRGAGSVSYSLFVAYAFLAVLALPIFFHGFPKALIVLQLLISAIGLGAVLRERVLRDIKNSIFEIAFGILLAVFYFFQLNGARGATVFADSLARLGLVHTDDMYHSAIVNMLHYFEASSTGLDGVPFVFYHIGSHFWLSSLKHVVSADSVLLLSASIQIFAMPATILAIGVALRDVANSFENEKGSKEKSGIAYLWIFLSILWIVEIGGWDYYLLSLTHVFSLPIFAASIGYGFSILVRSLDSKKFEATMLVNVVVITATIAVLKVSSGVVAAAMFSVIFVFSTNKLYPRATKYIAVPILAAGSFVAVLIPLLWIGSDFFKIDVFNFPEAYPKQTLSYSLAFAFSVLVVLLFVRTGSDKKYGAILIMSVTFFVGSLPGFFFRTPHPIDHYFFLHAGAFVSLLTAASVLFNYAIEKSPLRKTRFPVEISVVAALAINLTTFLATESKRYRVYETLDVIAVLKSPESYDDRRAYNRLLETKPIVERTLLRANVLLGLIQTVWKGEPLMDDFVRSSLAGTPFSRFIDTVNLHLLNNPGSLPLVYVRPSMQEFWGAQEFCWVQSFVSPALLGLPMLNGVPKPGGTCTIPVFYAFPAYESYSRNEEMTDERICERAATLGFSRVLSIESGFSVSEKKCSG